MDENQVKAIVKAIGYVENGGKPDEQHLSAGKSGEMKSIFQFTPDTWKHDAGKYLNNPNTPLTSDNETHLMVLKVADQLKKGYTPQQIFSMHNAGIGEPNAYGGTFSNGRPSVGTNKYGVRFDVPSYVKKGMSYVDQFSKEQSPNIAQTNSPIPQGQTTHQQIPQSSQGGQPQGLQELLSMIQGVKKTSTKETTTGAKKNTGLVGALISPKIQV